MTEVVLFVDAVELVVNYLDARLDTPVRGRVPSERPAAFIRIQRIGGTRLNIVTDDAMLSVECWADAEEDAFDLAQLARGYLHAMRGTSVDGVMVYRIAEIAGPALLPDPISDQPRAVFTVLIAIRGDVQQLGS